MGDEEFTGAEETVVPGKKAGMRAIILVVVIAVVMAAAGFLPGGLPAAAVEVMLTAGLRRRR